MDTGMKKYYIIIFYLEQHHYYTLWYTDDVDGFIISAEGNIVYFEDEVLIKKFARDNEIYLDDETTEIFCNELFNIDDNNIHCNDILTFWNIVSDMARSAGKLFLGDYKHSNISDIYNKLFYGCNLPVIKQEGESYYPIWNHKEVLLLQKVINNGLDILSKIFLNVEISQ